MMLEIAIDIGGTFTDVVCLQEQQRLFLAKVPTTPHDLVEGVRQYERVCVTTFDAYVRPIVAVYMQRLADSLSAMGISATLQVMQSRGGLTSVHTVTERPVTMLLSGPASGVIGGRFAGGQSQAHNLLTLDMGGTSCDVALVKEGKPLISREGRMARYPLRVPMVDVSTVGAGGGSLAWLDSSGGLRVGPQSAGPDPGPACYGRGGTVPTVTDASIEHDQSRTFAVPAAAVDLAQMVQVLEELDRLGRDKMQRDRVPPPDVQIAHAADLRYIGQSYELEVPLPVTLGTANVTQAVADFHAIHRQVYGHSRPTHPVEFVNLRSVHSAPLPRPHLAPPPTGSSLEAALKGSRPAYFDEYQAYRDTPVYQRDRLPIGAQFAGPAIIEQPDTTTVVYPGFLCQADAAGNVLLHPATG
jgi:N-methylhydantoinase A/oxoprolinase/acetone carboxylase beta subunit